MKPLLLLFTGLFPLLAFAATDTLWDFSGANLIKADIRGMGLCPAESSVNYRRRLPTDVLLSGIYSTTVNMNQSTWPTAVSNAGNEFVFTYVLFRAYNSGLGNFLLEKRVRLGSQDSVIFFCLPDSSKAHNDSLGTALSRQIMLNTGFPAPKIGGVNTKSLAAPDGRVYRLCQGYGGNDSSLYVIDTIVSGNPITAFEPGITDKSFPDYCLNAAGDTIFAAYTPNRKILRILPIHLLGGNRVLRGTPVTIPSDSSRDLGIARDSATGKFLVVYCNIDTLTAASVNADLSGSSSAVLRTGMPSISDASRNLRVVSLGHSRFAISFFLSSNGSGGTRLMVVDLSAGITIVDSLVLDTARSLVPALSYSNDRLAALWLHDQDNIINYSGQVFAKIFAIRNGTIRDTLFSGAFSTSTAVTENFYSPPGNFSLAAALDINGSLFGAYARSDYRLYGNAFSPTFTYFDTAYAVVVDSLDGGSWGDLNGDSLIFSNLGFTAGGIGAVDATFRQDTIAAFATLRTAVTPATRIGPVMGKYFEWRLQMASANAGKDRPVVNRLFFQFNVKPRNAGIDSFSINNRAASPIARGETIRIFSRSDMLKAYASARDFDDASRIFASWNGFVTRVDTLPWVDTFTYARQALFDTMNRADAIYPLTFSVTDTNGWGSDLFTCSVRVYNPAPSLFLTASTFLFTDSTLDTLRNNDTLRFFKRHRTVLHALAADSNDASALSIEFRVNNSLHPPLFGGLFFSDTLFTDDVPGDTVSCRVRVLDPGGKGDSLSFTLVAVNDPPRDSLFFMSRSASGGTLLDSAIQKGDTLFPVESGYFVLSAAGRDLNDAALDHILLFNGDPLDSSLNALSFLDTLSSDLVDAFDTLALVVRDSFLAADTITFFLRVAHQPRIDSVFYRNSATLLTGDSTNLAIRPTIADTFALTVTDADVAYDDTLTFRLFLDGIPGDSSRGRFLATDLTRPAGRLGGRCVLSVTDEKGMKDSFVVFLKYPAFERTADLSADSSWLASGIFLYPSRRMPVDPASYTERAIRFRNTGTETLFVRSAAPAALAGAGDWISLGYSESRAHFPDYSPLLLAPQPILPGESLFLFIRNSVTLPFKDSAGIHLSSVNGDTAYLDTLVITLSDPDQDTLRFPIRITVAEPPFLVRDSIFFLGAVPALPRASAAYVPRNAPYRKAALVFSEALNPSDITARNLTFYSVPDSALFGADSAVPIPGRYQVARSAGCRFDTVYFTPLCASNAYTSPHFQATPPDSFFIASDRIRVKLASRLRDLAGHRADLEGDYRPDTLGAFKILSASVDSASLAIESLDPDSGAETPQVRPLITVLFSAALDSASIDTAITGNRSVRIYSSFMSGMVPLDAPPAVSGRTLAFRPAVNFFGGESIAVLLSSSIRDLYRNTLDGNRDGTGAFFLAHGGASYAQINTFATTSSAVRDNVAWSFRTVRQDFYFFPCPFEPGRDSRHAAQGGIVFKNLHSLAKDGGITSLNIRIMDVAGDPVYSTRKHGIAVPCRTQGTPPLWKWDSRNDAGRNVASGIYLFAISDSRDANILHRGKLIVIR